MADKMPVYDWASAGAESFKIFKQRMELYFTVKGVNDEAKTSHTLLAIGEEGLRKYNSLVGLSETDKKDYKKIFEKLLEQIEPAENYRVCRLKLTKYCQGSEETLDEFVNRCNLLAKKCEFSKEELNERLIEQIILGTQTEDFKRELLKQAKGYSLVDALKLGRYMKQQQQA